MPSSALPRPEYAVHNPALQQLLRTTYTLADLSAIISALGEHGTLRLRRYKNAKLGFVGGASAVTIVDIEDALESALGDNLQYMWTRDSVMQSIAERIAADDPELKAASQIRPTQWRQGLWANLKHYEMHQQTFVDVIWGRPKNDGTNQPITGLYKDAAYHPAIRFNAKSLKTVPWVWSHKQNDAHGALNFQLFWELNNKRLFWSDPDLNAVAVPYAALLHHLFFRCNVAADWDFGAWEDVAAEHQSSIMCVAVGLAEELDWLRANGAFKHYSAGNDWWVKAEGVEQMLKNCIAKLKELGTDEARRGELGGKVRTSDSAQLNGLLLQALAKRQILDDVAVEAIISRIESELMGFYGIARYLGDTWDGREHGKSDRPEFVRGRDEMKWYFGSPQIVYILGERYLRTGEEHLYEWLTYHFSRAIAGIDADWHTPEGWRISKESGQWERDNNCPLAWSQAALILALSMMKACVAKKPQFDAGKKKAAEDAAKTVADAAAAATAVKAPTPAQSPAQPAEGAASAPDMAQPAKGLIARAVSAVVALFR
jgi:hypothetical protein